MIRQSGTNSRLEQDDVTTVSPGILASKKLSLRRIAQDAVYTESALLLLGTVLLSGLGALFWLCAAYSYSPEEVGVATALLAVLNLITSLSLLGFEITLVRYLAHRQDPVSYTHLTLPTNREV